jgi:hypothetical protein
MKNQIIYIAVFSMILGGCTKDITEFNTNPKTPEVVPAGMLYANAQKDLVYYLASPSVNVNTFRLWSQHWTQTTYVDESNYELTERNINGEVYDRLYANVLRDLSEARLILEEDELVTAADAKVQMAMISLLEVYTYHVLVDIFNDVPYSSSNQLIDDLAPSYDDAKTIYLDLGKRLDAIVADLGGSGSTGELGASDLIYNGDATLWVEFAHSLKLKLALRLADVDAGTAQGWAEGSANKSLSSSASNAMLYFESAPPNTNPLWEDLVQSGRTDFVASQTLGDAMNETNDPRRAVYFRALDSLGNIVGNAHGGGGAYSLYSQPGDLFEDPGLPATLITYDEVLFLKAEASARGWAVGGSVQSFYNSAIDESMAAWGVDIDTFLTQSTVDYDDQIAAGKTWKEIIGNQKWIAMYDRGLEAYSTWRLYDAPTMADAVEAGTPPPFRYNYSVDEYSVNEAAVSGANGGSDNVMDKVFWDVN